MTIDEIKNDLFINSEEVCGNTMVDLYEAQDCCDNSYKIGYNKAIDEAMIASANAICIGCGYLDGTQCTYKGSNCGVSKPMLETVMKVLKQLKAGGENE